VNICDKIRDQNNTSDKVNQTGLPLFLQA